MASSLCRQVSRLCLHAAPVASMGRAQLQRLSSRAAATLPANVQMAEGLGVFEEEPKMNILPMEMLFAPLKPPTSIKVHMFRSPGQFLQEDAPMDPTVFGVAIR